MSNILEEKPGSATETLAVAPEKAPPKQFNIVGRKPNLRYLVGVVSGLSLILCSFLPWLTVRYETIKQQISINGLGTVDSSTNLAKLNELPTIGGGFGPLIIGLIALGLATAGVFFHRTELAAILTVFGLFAVGLMLHLLNDTISKLNEVTTVASPFYQVVRDELKISPPMKVSLDYGLLLGIVAALALVLGGLLPMAGKQRRRLPRRA